MNICLKTVEELQLIRRVWSHNKGLVLVCLHMVKEAKEMKYDNLYTTETDKQFGVFVEIDRTHDIMRMTNEKQYVRVMELPKYSMYDDLLVDWRQYENEVHNWSKQAFNDNDGQIIKKNFN